LILVLVGNLPGLAAFGGRPEARGAGAASAGEARMRLQGSDPQRRERSAYRADWEPHA